MTNHLSTLRHMNRHVEGVCRCWLWIQLAVSVTSPVPPTCRRTEEMWRKAGLLRPEEQRAASVEESYSGHSVMTEESAGTAACSEEGPVPHVYPVASGPAAPPRYTERHVKRSAHALRTAILHEVVAKRLYEVSCAFVVEQHALSLWPAVPVQCNLHVHACHHCS